MTKDVGVMGIAPGRPEVLDKIPSTTDMLGKIEELRGLCGAEKPLDLGFVDGGQQVLREGQFRQAERVGKHIRNKLGRGR